MEALRVENITKSYKKKIVLNSISFCLEENNTLVFLGLDNSGKTTLSKILGLINKVDSGSIYYFNEERTPYSNDNQDVSLMPDSLGLSEHLTVFENLLLMAESRHIKSKGAKDLVIEYMQKYDLIDRYYDKVKTLSISLKKIVSFVLSLLADTKVLVLDEPFKDIDIKAKKRLMEYILELKKIKTIIITTEDPTIALSLADTVYLLEDGTIRKIDDFSNVDELEKILLDKRGEDNV